MAKQRKVPMRRCIVCQQSIEKKALFRIVRSPEGDVSLDLTGKKNGRGAYLCMNASCVQKAKAKNSLAHHLGVPVPAAVFDDMMAYLEEHHLYDGE